MKKSNIKVIVGLSGGVDSSVAALQLLNAGYHVEGLFMKNWEEDDTQAHCAAAQDVQDAKAVCEILNIKLHTINFSAEYWDNVFENFLNEFKAGRTPNPDILCNKEIKFKVFLNYALKLGADYIATGHYARIQIHNTKYQLIKSVDKRKDQSYFLYALNQQALSKSLFPVGELEKSEVRRLAQEAGFKNHQKKDSTGICFIGEKRFQNFLSQYIKTQIGPIKTLENIEIGSHQGVLFYTIGQRQGLKIGGLTNGTNEPWFVAKKDIVNNILYVVQGAHHSALLTRILIFSQAHWISNIPPKFPFTSMAKICYQQEEQGCTIQSASSNSSGQDLTVIFDMPQRAVTPGQAIVFYDGEACLGGGIIN